MDGLAQRKRCQGCGHVRGMGEPICERCGWASWSPAFVALARTENDGGAENSCCPADAARNRDSAPPSDDKG